MCACLQEPEDAGEEVDEERDAEGELADLEHLRRDPQQTVQHIKNLGELQDAKQLRKHITTHRVSWCFERKRKRRSKAEVSMVDTLTSRNGFRSRIKRRASVTLLVSTSALGSRELHPGTAAMSNQEVGKEVIMSNQNLLFKYIFATSHCLS
eukprot:2221327-Rhodomonas_salina.1